MNVLKKQPTIDRYLHNMSNEDDDMVQRSSVLSIPNYRKDHLKMQVEELCKTPLKRL
jgi:hypothetical protein